MGHSPTPNRTRRVDRPALLTTRINVFPSQPDKGTKEHPLIAPIARKYFIDQGASYSIKIQQILVRSTWSDQNKVG